ncbi:shikimate dehydrogenase [Seohaeicola saemankumensis]|nr:shikimate dehydrogenase [Seohaeicola saemankumensis]MCA0869600.1 shikimate dehydrogenase [Seohaeicola saemankumensis]
MKHNGAAAKTDPDLQLGLIGDNIAASRAPVLHRLAGEQSGLTVIYDRLVPPAMELTFAEVFAKCAQGGFHGINVTYPYKERVVAYVTVEDPLVRAIGAVNTVVFETTGPKGYNTDYSGFVTAYRRERGDVAPGVCCMIGAGGVGRAVAFGLLALGAEEIRLVDMDVGRADALAADLRSALPSTKVTTGTDTAIAVVGAQGVLNCTPVGMDGLAGTPVPREALRGAEWAFDAVYTPVNTQFLSDSRAEGLQLISGYELFFYQGVDAWARFAGKPLDEDRLRADLARG